MTEENLGTDLRLNFNAQGDADLVVGLGDLVTVTGRRNLEQALTVRLLMRRGELSKLGHPRYGSRLHEFIGQMLDTSNMELLRRYVKRTILEDPRVDDVVFVGVSPRSSEPGVVDVEAVVKAISGEEVAVGVILDVG